MEQRTVKRFRQRAILIHWLNAISSGILMVTGAIIFFDLTTMVGGQQIRIIHQMSAVFFVAVPVLFTLFDPGAVLSFLKEAFNWNRDDISWLKSSIGFYFGRKVEMPPQGYINGDQKLWQLVVIVSGLVLASSGILMWFFKLKIPWILYQGLLLTHASAFIVITFMFLIHFYLSTLHPQFEESLSSMVDGKVSSSYAEEHYRKWHTTVREK